MIYSQKRIFDYLAANPLGVDVRVGDVDNLNGKDYLFYNILYDTLIGSDNRGVYKTRINITVATRDFANRKTLTDYLKEFLNLSVTYGVSEGFEYYTAVCECDVLLCEGDDPDGENQP